MQMPTQTWTRSCRQTLALLLVAATVAIGPVVSSARAELVTTAAAIAAADDLDGARERVAALLGRDDIRRQLESLGVSPAEADARIASLSDREIGQLDARIAALPAGQDFLALVATILVITVLALLVGDLLGWTDVFSFINPLPRGEARRSRNR